MQPIREVPKDDRRRIKALWDGNFCSLSTALRCTAHCSSNASSKALPRNRGAPKSSTPATSTLVNAEKGGSCVSDRSGAYTSHLDWLRLRPIEVSSSVMIFRSWATPPASPPKVTSSKKPILNYDVRVCSTGCNGRQNSRGPNESPCWGPISDVSNR